MYWLVDLFRGDSTAHAILILSLVIAAGVALGRIRIRGVSFGIAGVLFAGILFAHFGVAINGQVLDFVKDFGLVLFVYMIGLQVGPGFFASFRRQGLAINLQAVSIVVLGVGVTILLHLIFSLPIGTLAGILAGAVTNTPSLGAAQQALKDVAGLHAETGLGYAVAYPFGVIGVIFSIVLMKSLFRVQLQKETESFRRAQAAIFPPPDSINLEVKNPQLSGKPLKVLGEVIEADIVVSRILRRGNLFLPDGDSTLEPGDVLLAVGSRDSLDKLKFLVGDESPVDLKKFPGNLQSSQILVTQKGVIGRSLSELQLRQRFGVNITRVLRAGMEFVPNPEVHLQFGDKLTVVGEEDMIQQLSILLGNSMKRLEVPNVMPVFLGIIAGVLAGSMPIVLPGMPVPLKLGIAGGPLIVAILMGRFGNVGRFSSYVPSGANLMLREVGIVLFLSCVGLRAGIGFVPLLSGGDGLLWMGLGAFITLAPVWLVGLFSRLILKENFLVISGLLSGSMTDPPALAFASEYLRSDAPALTYASVYPLVTFLRILSAQLLVLFFVR